MSYRYTRVSGLDLAAESYNCTGYAVIDLTSMSLVRIECLYGDDQIVSNIASDRIGLVSIDSPITREPKYRLVDKEAVKRGFRVLPPSFKHMKKLALRGWKLYEKLTSEGIEVIETHPRSAIKSSGVSDYITLAERLGVNLGDYRRRKLGKDLRDALISALVAVCYTKVDCLLVISAEDGSIYLIKPLVLSSHL
ncbi:MAG: DUF429 domain-containing protein [Sulfolobales archaeon]|nr:DUF429 domain-containing protein [Sulfolobales archaeon]MDW8083216.1 DUF429 domain-containing protein [Sulfolobales archaeon]